MRQISLGINQSCSNYSCVQIIPELYTTFKWSNSLLITYHHTIQYRYILAAIFYFFSVGPEDAEKDYTDRKQCQMSLSKKISGKGLCGRCFICLRPPPLPSYDPILTPPYTLYRYRYVYTVYLFTLGRGGGASQRRLEGQ